MYNKITIITLICLVLTASAAYSFNSFKDPRSPEQDRVAVTEDVRELKAIAQQILQELKTTNNLLRQQQGQKVDGVKN